MKDRFKTRDGIVLSLSGGLDSTTLLAMAVAKYGCENIFALGFHYGSRHNDAEIAQAHEIASFYQVDFQLVELPRLFNDGSALMDADYDVSRLHNLTYAELAEQEGSQPTVVANRNMNFIAMCTTHAMVKGVNRVWLGMHADDAAGFAYPDCTVGFVGAMSAAVQISSEGAVNLEAPLNHMTKVQIVEAGLKLDVPYDLTQSCYKGIRPACGVCSTCLDRIDAFRNNGRKDPAPYVTT
jgi:7-cyano-7-deazaguanine synthase